MRLSKTGKIIIQIKGNGILSKQGFRIQVKKRMKHHIRSSMHLIEGRDFSLRRRTRVMVGSLYSFGLRARIIVGEISHNIRVVDRRSTMPRWHKQWKML